MANGKWSDIVVYDITFYQYNEETGEERHYNYDGDCSFICDVITLDELTLTKKEKK